jgi:hypothetical protein
MLRIMNSPTLDDFHVTVRTSIDHINLVWDWKSKTALTDKVKLSRLLELQYDHKQGMLEIIMLSDYMASMDENLLTWMIE